MVGFGNVYLFGQAVNLDELVREALDNNPRLQAYKSGIQVDEARVPQAGALPDPILSFNILNVPATRFSFDQQAMSGKQIALRQNIPFPGKLGLKQEIAEKNQRISSAIYEEAKQALIRDVKLAYYDLYYGDITVSTIEKDQRLLEQLVAVSEKKYTVGQGLQQDVLKAQVELSKMHDRLIRAREARHKVVIRINTLLNRPIGQSLGHPQLPDMERPEFSRDSLQQKIQSNRSLLKVWQIRLQQSGQALDLAKKSYLPDLSLFVAYTQRDRLRNGNGGVDFLSGGISFNLPVYFWRKQDKQVQEKVWQRERISESYVHIQEQIRSELENVLSELEQNGSLVELYKKGIVPQAGQSFQAALIGYQTDRLDFLTLVNNLLTYFNFELEYNRVLTNYYKNLAQLAYVIGS